MLKSDITSFSPVSQPVIKDVLTEDAESFLWGKRTVSVKGQEVHVSGFRSQSGWAAWKHAQRQTSVLAVSLQNLVDTEI